jgi:hypothetical protein
VYFDRLDRGSKATAALIKSNLTRLPFGRHNSGPDEGFQIDRLGIS